MHGKHVLRVCLALTFGALSIAAPAEAATDHLTYRVNHSSYGGIGTYTNIVETNGDTTTVTTEGRIRVAILGIQLYRQDADRVERWMGGRIVSFHGVTKTNGNPAVEVNGSAQGDHFVINSAEAPASVRPANPWSPDVLKGDVMFTTDRGRIEQIRVSDAGEERVVVGHGEVTAKHYQIDRGGGRRYDVWIDGKNTVVKFSLVNPNNTVSFTLDR